MLLESFRELVENLRIIEKSDDFLTWQSLMIARQNAAENLSEKVNFYSSLHVLFILPIRKNTFSKLGGSH